VCGWGGVGGMVSGCWWGWGGGGGYGGVGWGGWGGWGWGGGGGGVGGMRGWGGGGGGGEGGGVGGWGICGGGGGRVGGVMGEGRVPGRQDDVPHSTWFVSQLPCSCAHASVAYTGLSGTGGLLTRVRSTGAESPIRSRSPPARGPVRFHQARPAAGLPDWCPVPPSSDRLAVRVPPCQVMIRLRALPSSSANRWTDLTYFVASNSGRPEFSYSNVVDSCG